SVMTLLNSKINRFYEATVKGDKRVI
ncbi:MAG: hypothetical protein ACI9OI_001490, partial [Chitinophagales bacterium]